MSLAVSVGQKSAGGSTLQACRDLLAITKPRVIVLLEITTLFAMVMAASGWPNTGLVFATLIGGWLAASGAHAINSWYDRDIDSQMARTRNRPLVAGRVPDNLALAFGITLGALAFAELGFLVNWGAATLAVAALLFYVFVYTMWLKRSSTQNIVIGGAAGAFPPLVGWVAVTGHLDLFALYLFAIIFYWTPPHFWALALLLQRDYAQARIPMLPVVFGDKETRRQILLYTIIMVLVTLLPLIAEVSGNIYLWSSALLNGIFLCLALRAARQPSARSARQLFYYSLLYLALLFGALAIDRVVLG